MKRRLKIVGLALAAVLTVAACSSGSDSATTGTAGGSGAASGSGAAPSGRQAINIWLYQKPLGVFSPIAPASGPDSQVMSLMYEGLLAVDPTYQLQPVIAAAMPEVSADATTFTFKIRPGLKWSDGEPLTSKDVLFSYQRVADPKSGSAFAASYSSLVGYKEFTDGTAPTIAGLSAPDDSTFVITSTTPNYGLLAQIGILLIMPEHILGKEPVDQFATNAYWNAPTVASGPYMFAENKVDQYVKLTANPQYRDPVGIKDVYLKPTTADVATAQLGTGEMDVSSISAVDSEAVGSMSGITISTIDTGGFVRMTLNLTQQRFADPRIRQAFLYGIDRQAIIDSALAGKANVRNSVFGPQATSDKIDDYAYDPAKAKELLAAAGWDSSQSVKIAWIAGVNPDRDAAVTAIQDQLGQIGVTIELQQVQAAYFPEAYKEMTFDAVLYGGGDYAVSPWNTRVVVGCDQFTPNGGNVGHYCNEEVDALLAKANQTVDETQRLDLYKQASLLENGDPSQLWLYNPQGIWAVTSSLEGFQGLDPTGRGFWKAAGWHFTS